MGFPRVSAAKSGGFFSFKFSSRLEAGGTSWERENPLLPKRGFSLSQTLSLSQHGLGFHPKTPLSPLARHGFALQKYFCGLPDAISDFKNTFLASLAQFQRSKILSLLSRRNFGFQKCFYCFPSAFSAFGGVPTACPGAFSCFKSIPKTSPARFWLLGAFPRVSRRVFGVREHSQEFPGAVLAFGNIPKSFPAWFWRSGVFPRVSRRIFCVREYFFVIKCSKKHTEGDWIW